MRKSNHSKRRSAKRSLRTAAALLGTLCALSSAAADLNHGLWVWHGPRVLAQAGAAQRLRDYCRARGIDEIYLAVTEHGNLTLDRGVIEAVEALRGAGIHVEALLSSDSADVAGPHRDKLINEVRGVAVFNRQHPKGGFDGIHLDIEPQQRPENKGADNLMFLQGLVEAYRAARVAADGMSVDADIQTKLLKGTSTQRRELLTSLPRLTLMLYEIGGSQMSKPARMRQVQSASERFLAMAYADLPEAGLASLSIALRTADYGVDLPDMLNALDEANRANAHYAGWAQHAYEDRLGEP
jgi:hypothetical protein